MDDHTINDDEEMELTEYMDIKPYVEPTKKPRSRIEPSSGIMFLPVSGSIMPTASPYGGCSGYLPSFSDIKICPDTGATGVW